MGKASVKVPDGKLVNVETEGENSFQDVKIRGDFFIEPPEALQELENSLKGLNKGCSKERMVEKLETVEAELIGFSRKDIAEAVKQSVGDEK